MSRSHLPSDESAASPAGVEAGPQGGAGGAGGEPKGAQLKPRSNASSAPGEQADHLRREHSSDKAQPGYRARPAGQSGIGEQPDRPSPLREPQGEGNYVATDRGDKPLRNG
ncbi:MAG TPA: hypothetical protein VGU03_09605 [Frateuria sp.]|uniref:hypothetical protein n=1 Tax=Frateuria sp. TaxID=2211372 RepID=UPI002DF2D811|nr:hypothetical protein [Frateuria sp.]